MKVRIIRGIKQVFTRRNVMEMEESSNSNHLGLDIREEYANAFRTQSYNQFWERVLAFTLSPGMAMASTTASRLPSYRLFVDHLLDPDQPTVTRILALTQTQPQTLHPLLADYFFETANASFLCSHLLRDVDNTRIRYKSLTTTLDSLLPQISPVLTESNPFLPSNRIQAVQTNCSDLLQRLELNRDKVQSKFQLITKLKRGSAAFLVVLTASLTIVIAAHALAVIVAAPCVLATSPQLFSAKKLARWSTQLDSAAKGTYILMRDLDTISQLVGRLSDELEHVHATIRFCLARGDHHRLQTSGEVARQLKMNDANFSDQLDELEEHLYLCFMTINKARNLVLKEILNHNNNSNNNNNNSQPTST